MLLYFFRILFAFISLKSIGGEKNMPDYKAMYHILCAAADRAVTLLEEQENSFLAEDILKAALLQAEEIYIETADDP